MRAMSDNKLVHRKLKRGDGCHSLCPPCRAERAKTAPVLQDLLIGICYTSVFTLGFSAAFAARRLSWPEYEDLVAVYPAPVRDIALMLGRQESERHSHENNTDRSH